MVQRRDSHATSGRTFDLLAGAGSRSTTAITRPSRLGSIVTGSLSVAITRARVSSCSVKYLLLQNFAQRFARAQHAHLERRHARAGQLLHLVVAEILDMFQQKRLALIGRQLLQCPVDGLLPSVLVLSV